MLSQPQGHLHRGFPTAPGSATPGVVTLFVRWGFQRYSRAKKEVTSEQGTLKLDGTLWLTGTHHIILSLGFALQWLDFRIIKSDRLAEAGPRPGYPPHYLHLGCRGVEHSGSLPYAHNLGIAP
jgi:hypothetical protein